MTENFPNLVKEKDTQVQEAQRIPKTLDPKRATARHIKIKMTRLKDRERIPKATREKQVITYKGASIRLSSDYSIETFQARREWHEIFKVMKSEHLQPRILYQARLSFKNEGGKKELPRQEKAKGICLHQTSTTTNVKGFALRRRKRERKQKKKNRGK